MNETIKVLKERRSVRKFKNVMPSNDDIKTIVEAGLYAPSGKGKQDIIILVITNKEIRDELASINNKIGGWEEGHDPFYGAPVVLMVLGDKNWPLRVYDGSLVMGNLMNASYALGIDSIWIHRAKEESELPWFKDFLKNQGIEGEWEGIGHCVIGYRDGELPKPAPRRENRVYFVK